MSYPQITRITLINGTLALAGILIIVWGVFIFHSSLPSYEQFLTQRGRNNVLTVHISDPLNVNRASLPCFWEMFRPTFKVKI